MAGLWERWVAADGQVVESCTIVTVDANTLVAELHDRMPLILAPGDYNAWLNAETREAALPHAVAAEDMVAYPVSSLVSNAKNDVPACLAPIDAR